MVEPRDKLGNILREGDLVQVDLGENHVIGKIVQIQAGGLVIPGNKNKHSPGMIRVITDMTLTYNPDGGLLLGKLLKTIDPAKQEIIEKALEAIDKEPPEGPTGPQLVS